MKGDELDCSVDRSVSPGTIPQNARDKLNKPIKSCPQERIQRLVISNQFFALLRHRLFTQDYMISNDFWK